MDGWVDEYVNKWITVWITCQQVESINDRTEFRSVETALRTIGLGDVSETLWQILASVLHLVRSINCFKPALF